MITIKQSIDLFIKSLEVENKAEDTIKTYASDINLFYLFIKEVLGNKIRYVEDIKFVHLQMYKNFLTDKYSNNCTKARKFNCLRTYINIMYSNGFVNELLYRKLSSDSYMNRKRDRSCLKSFISEKTIVEILKYVKNSTSNNKYRDIALFNVLKLGLRRSDILNLKFNNINFSKSTLKIYRTKNNNVDVVTLPQSTLLSLKELFFVTENKNFVFVSNNNTQLSRTAFNSIIRKYTNNFKDTDSNKITAHTFRHSFITNMIKMNVQLSVIQKYVGISLETLRTYTHLDENDTKDVATLIDTLF